MSSVPKDLLYLLAADALLFIHAMFVAFVVFGLLLIYIGRLRKWCWVRNFWFRVAHLLGMVIVMVQSWFGLACPFTVWEMALRNKAGAAVYSGSFVSHWLGSLLYYQAPNWVFVVAYTAFAVLVVVSWFVVRPIRSGEKS